MSTKNQCDICEKEAVDTIEAKSGTTTTIKLDVCIDHLAEVKKIMRIFTGQELSDQNQCDICDKEAVDTIEAKSGTTTTIKLDVCEEHLAEFKRIMRIFTGQEVG